MNFIFTTKESPSFIIETAVRTILADQEQAQAHLDNILSKNRKGKMSTPNKASLHYNTTLFDKRNDDIELQKLKTNFFIKKIQNILFWYFYSLTLRTRNCKGIHHPYVLSTH